ncbi:MAG: hypothetical protein QHI38_00065 [Armatimonadota bacterium]|nr:hypothetical protein [Armatimonadota bacterium]
MCTTPHLAKAADPMRDRVLLIVLACVLALCFCPTGLCSEIPADNDKISIKTTFTPREIRDYKIDAVITGKTASSDSESAKPIDLKAAFHLVVRHRYGQREGDGLLPVEISLLKGQAQADSNTLELNPSLYPKLTALVDREWQVTDIFGMPQERIAETLTGINYANHIVLFYLPGASEPRRPGDKWTYALKIPALNESYEFTNQIVRLETIDGIPAAVVRQEIVGKPCSPQENTRKASFKAITESVFAINGGRLLKSQTECQISTTDQDDAASAKTTKAAAFRSQATVQIDISPFRGSDSQ